MNSLPRRSARLSQRYTQDNNQFPERLPQSLPSFSVSSSTSTTSHPSPVSDLSTITSQEQERIRLQIHSQFGASQSHFQAPLPSPSANESDLHFARLHSQGFFAMASQSQQMNGQQQQQFAYNNVGQSQYQQQQQQHTSHHHNSFSQPQRQVSVQNNTQASNPGQLPPDFLAEAARRAQMACLMRDLGDVTLWSAILKFRHSSSNTPSPQHTLSYLPVRTSHRHETHMLTIHTKSYRMTPSMWSTLWHLYLGWVVFYQKLERWRILRSHMAKLSTANIPWCSPRSYRSSSTNTGAGSAIGRKDISDAIQWDMEADFRSGSSWSPPSLRTVRQENLGIKGSIHFIYSNSVIGWRCHHTEAENYNWDCLDLFSRCSRTCVYVRRHHCFYDDDDDHQRLPFFNHHRSRHLYWFEIASLMSCLTQAFLFLVVVALGNRERWSSDYYGVNASSLPVGLFLILDMFGIDWSHSIR